VHTQHEQHNIHGYNDTGYWILMTILVHNERKKEASRALYRRHKLEYVMMMRMLLLLLLLESPSVFFARAILIERRLYIVLNSIYLRVVHRPPAAFSSSLACTYYLCVCFFYCAAELNRHLLTGIADGVAAASHISKITGDA
jgi:hypothetical protein